MTLELLLTIFIIPLVSLIGLLIWHKLTGICNQISLTKKEVEILSDRFIAYEEMKMGVERRCPFYKQVVVGPSH